MAMITRLVIAITLLVAFSSYSDAQTTGEGIGGGGTGVSGQRLPKGCTSGIVTDARGVVSCGGTGAVEAPNTVLSGPSSGTTPGVSSYRPLVTSDIPVIGNLLTISSSVDPVAQGSMIVNGDMTIDQVHEGGVASCPQSLLIGIVIDRWRCAFTSTFHFTPQRVNDGPTLYAYSLLLTVNATDTITSGFSTQIRTFVDPSFISGLAWGGSFANTVVLDFCAKASTSGTYVAFISNGGLSYLAPYTIVGANAWQCFSNVIPGPISSTWTSAFQVGFDLGSGSDFAGTPNTWNVGNLKTVSGAVGLAGLAVGQTLNITAVHLRTISAASVPYNPRPYAQELALARQWFRKSFPQGVAVAFNAGVVGARCVTNPVANGSPSYYEQFEPPMISTPTIVMYNPSADANIKWRDVTASVDKSALVDPASAIGNTGFHVTVLTPVTNAADTLCIHYAALADN